MSAVMTSCEIAEEYQRSSIAELSMLRVEQSGESITLSGVLPTFYLKSVAQEIAMPHLVGRRLLNRIDVPKKG